MNIQSKGVNVNRVEGVTNQGNGMPKSVPETKTDKAPALTADQFQIETDHNRVWNIQKNLGDHQSNVTELQIVEASIPENELRFLKEGIQAKAESNGASRAMWQAVSAKLDTVADKRQLSDLLGNTRQAEVRKIRELEVENENWVAAVSGQSQVNLGELNSAISGLTGQASKEIKPSSVLRLLNP